MKKDISKDFLQSLKSTFLRFPFAVFYSVFLTIILIVLISDDYEESESLLIIGNVLFSGIIYSILAKVYRDRIMCCQNSLYPQYGFSSNKGYGTSQHLDALVKYGPCPVHRLTFKHVSQ